MLPNGFPSTGNLLNEKYMLSKLMGLYISRKLKRLSILKLLWDASNRRSQIVAFGDLLNFVRERKLFRFVELFNFNWVVTQSVRRITAVNCWTLLDPLYLGFYRSCIDEHGHIFR